jgi:hypothetical protein
MIHEGRVDAQQLRAFRKLTPASAALVERTWKGTASRRHQEFGKIEHALASLDKLDKQRQVFTRQEQRILREVVVGKAETALCALCNREFPTAFLVAAHIKKRSACSDRERRDFENNVIPMCKLGCDDLFERGYVAVRDGIVRSTRRTRTEALDAYLSQIVGERCRRWNTRTAKYFRWHAMQTGRGAGAA